MSNYKFKVTYFPYCLLSVLLIALILISEPSAKAIQPISANAAAAILVETASGDVFYASNIHKRLPPASTTKIMTVLLAIEAYERGEVDIRDMVEASSTSHDDLTWDGSTQNIVPGEIMSLENLMYCAMVASANEACNIIGEYIAGTHEAFIQLMNERASELGCTNTNFVNTHGLPDENHYSSAYDLYLITNEAMQHSLFVRIANTVRRDIPPTNVSEESRSLVTTNNLINPESAYYYYSYAVGVKTGSTDAAGFCLVSSAEKDSVKLIAVILGAGASPRDDGSYQIESFTESKKLYEWFYANYSYQEILSSSDLISQVRVELGEGTDSVIVRPAESLSLLLPNDVDVDRDFSRDIDIFSERDGAPPLTAPISKGDVIGEITLRYDGNVYGPFNLITNTSVELSKIEFMKNKIADTLNQAWLKWTIFAVVLIFALYFAFVIRYNILRYRRRQEIKRRRLLQQQQQFFNDNQQNDESDYFK